MRRSPRRTAGSSSGLRPYQLATAAVLIVIAAVAMFDTRSGALPDPTGRAPGGLRGGWYPFWSAALMAAAAALVLVRTARGAASGDPLFATPQGARHMLLLVVPMTIAILGMSWLGFYIVAALYMAFFMKVIGHYRWPWIAGSALLVSVGFFVLFEKGFLVPLPKSIFYSDTFPF